MVDCGCVLRGEFGEVVFVWYDCVYGLVSTCFPLLLSIACIRY